MDIHDDPVIRPERPDGEDSGAIHALTTVAFTGAEHSSGTEAAIIDTLRQDGALAVSLVAVHAGRLVGHVAASRVTLDPPDAVNWYGIGPLSVHPEFQRQGIGSGLMRAVLDSLADLGAAGAVLLGEPSLYSRFGFQPRPELTMAGLAPEHSDYFQALRIDTPPAAGVWYPEALVNYHHAFADAEN